MIWGDFFFVKRKFPNGLFRKPVSDPKLAFGITHFGIVFLQKNNSGS